MVFIFHAPPLAGRVSAAETTHFFDILNNLVTMKFIAYRYQIVPAF